MSTGLRRIVAGAGRILGLAVLFLIIFTGSAFLIVFLLAWFKGTHLLDGANLYIGIVCGLITWLFMAVFHLRKETITLPFFDQAAFLNQVETILIELGYELKAPAGESRKFKPTFRSFLLGGSIQIAIAGPCGKITGPKVCLEIIRKRMRIRNHLDNIPQAIQEGRRRQGERLLKRVQLTLRLTPKQWQDTYQQVIQPLANEGSVLCDLNILAQNDTGIPDQVVELQVRPWLQAKGLAVEIHKTPLYEPSKAPIQSGEDLQAELVH